MGKTNGRAPIRCAIYTRKSSEEGLEQEFNSLDAQRESCEAFILSQKQEGWHALEQMYDDGGVSGATMERPALKRLLSDIERGKVDTVVTYKVDRLTRSLADFAKMVDIFDAHHVSFVSVTQQFNTTSSMGRLTLNVLLSFAQFEREVTGERIRDKIAASKKKGLWMGGLPPLGYEADDRRLVVKPEEAETVRHIFRRYVDLGSIRLLKQDLDRGGVVNKVRVDRNGRNYGGKPIARGALHRMLSNRIYRGEIVHKDQSYPGSHDPIVDQDLWDRAQATLATNRFDRKTAVDSKNPSLLAGLLYDEQGGRMTPSHAVKAHKRYRYYVSQALIKQGMDLETNTVGRRLPAGDIEHLVVHRVGAFLADQSAILKAIEAEVQDAASQRRLIDRADQLPKDWSRLANGEMRALLLAIVTRVEVHTARVDIRILPQGVAGILQQDSASVPPAANYANPQDLQTLSITSHLKRAGLEMKMVVAGAETPGAKKMVDASLLKLIVRAHELKEKLLLGDGASLTDVARSEGISRSYFTRLLRLSFLSPAITIAILEGRQPQDLTANRLLNDTRLPLDWDEQKVALGFT